MISYLYDPDEIFQTNVARCTPAQFIAGPHRPDETGNRPRDAGLSQAAGTSRHLRRRPGAATSLAARSLSLPSLSCPPSRQRQRKEELAGSKMGWIDRATGRRQRRNRVCWWGRGGRRSGCNGWRPTLPATRCRSPRAWPLTELAHSLESCAVFVGHDSGITHLAAALGLPCLVLWADTLEALWRPQGETLLVLRELGGINAISIERVMRELAGLLGSARDEGVERQLSRGGPDAGNSWSRAKED